MTRFFANTYRWLFIVGLLVHMVAMIGPRALSADVKYIHDYTSEDLLLDTKDVKLTVAYTAAGMFVDKQTRFTGAWMKRFFGSVKQERVSTKFLMGAGQIREIDWQNGRVIVFDFSKLDNIQWIHRKKEAYHDIGEHLKQRYDVKAPVLDISIDPRAHTVAGYTCRLVTACLKLETVDLLKKTCSTTLVEQQLWLSSDVPGYAVFEAFHHRLAQKLGIDAERLGPLTYLLRYWNGPLTPIGDALRHVTGYAVKTRLTATAVYVSGTDTDQPKTIRRKIKEETVTLSSIALEPLTSDIFTEPDHFEVIYPE